MVKEVRGPFAGINTPSAFWSNSPLMLESFKAVSQFFQFFTSDHICQTFSGLADVKMEYVLCMALKLE
jgi:hypothetical protein